MKTNKNIDRLFQEKLKDLEVSPPDNVWNGIERNLKNNRPKSLLPLWFRIGSAAAILMLLTIGSVNYFNSEPSDINNGNTIVTGSDNENTPKIDEEIFKRDILNPPENGNVITEAENNDNKNDIISKIKLSNKEQPTNKGRTNSEKNQQKNIQNAVATTQSKSNLGESNTEIATNSNSLKQDSSLLRNKTEDNLTESNTEIATNNDSFKENSSLSNKNNDNTKTTNDNNNVAITANNVNSKSNSLNNNGYSASSDNIAQNNAKESVNNDLTEPKGKPLDTQVDFDEINEEENTVAQVEAEKTESLEDTLTKNIEEEKEAEENTKKWSIASVFGPVYYNSFTEKASPLDPEFISSPKKGSKSASYGVKIEYKLNKKLSLRSGVSLVSVGYEIRDVFISPSQQSTQRLTNIDYNSNSVILSINATNFLNNAQLETLNSVPTKGILNQEFGYIEVPLELKYKLNNNQKLGINLIGGFSTLFLNKNEVSVETSEFSSNLGEANNLNSVNFSGNLGIDVDYKINKNLYLNIVPMLKIHTSTFSKNADNFKPYILGVYTGLNYKF